jgi:hypothetical protein
MKRFVILSLFLMFLLMGFSSADLNLKLSGTVNNLSSDVYLKTNSLSTQEFDGFDMLAPDSPSEYSRFYSTISGGRILSIDSWAGENRTFNLTYDISNNISNVQTGNLELSWISLVGEGYDANLTFHGNDSTRINIIDVVNMRDSSSASVVMSGYNASYFTINLFSYPEEDEEDEDEGGDGGDGGNGGGGCTPNCLGKVCGSDGCGGSCGTCDVGENCEEGKCVSPCTSLCSLGDKRCVGQNSFQECGDFNGDSCYEWGTSRNCDFGKICSEGVCVSGECEPSWSCSSWTDCVDFLRKRTCKDLNGCETLKNIPVTEESCGPDYEYDNETGEYYDSKTGGRCRPNWICGDWGSCLASYGISDSLSGISSLEGSQKRTCRAQNCRLTKIEKRECDFRIPIRAEKTIWCEEEYVFVYDLYSNDLLSKIKISESSIFSKIKRVDLKLSVKLDEDCEEEIKISLFDVFNWRLLLIIINFILLSIILFLVWRENRKKKDLLYFPPVDSEPIYREKILPKSGPKKARFTYKEWLRKVLRKK